MDIDINKLIEVLNEIIDKEAKASVGMLCAEIEVLERNNSLKPRLFKESAKNTIYEQSRVLKKLCRAIAIPKIIFVSKEAKWVRKKVRKYYKKI